jgi:hypothetical protein
MDLLTFPKSSVLWNATVDLLSRKERPFRFCVTVTGLPPHAVTRKYEVKTFSPGQAAMLGGTRFEREMAGLLKVAV